MGPSPAFAPLAGDTYIQLEIIILLDHIGVFVFAVSGGLAAVRAKMDLFGVVALGFFTAVGGGTLRDLILDAPVFWLTDTFTLWLAASGGATAFFLHRYMVALKPLRWADAIGLSVFAVTGASKAIALGHGFLITISMGAMTATAGGLIRDVVANRDPLLLKEDIYATAALAGAAAFWLAFNYDPLTEFAALIGASTSFLIRSIAVVFRFNLPKADR